MIRMIIPLAVCTAAALAAHGVYGSFRYSDNVSLLTGTDDYQLDILNTWTIDYASMVLGMSAADNAILFVDDADTDERLYAADPSDMSYAGHVSLLWSNAYPYGTTYCYNVPFVNDCGDGLIRYGVDFNESFANPFGATGRGMSSDGTHIWEVNGGGTSTAQVGRFNTDGTGFQYWELPGINSQLSDMTIYPIAGSTGIAVTAYDPGTTHYVWFYQFDGSQCVLLGSAELPSNNFTTGLAYSAYTGTWFVSYLEGSAWKVSEFDVQQTVLHQSTWAGIKYSF
ncbi:MAG: hypothetical protein AVO35_06285 [Candidatus Aegiribacteria sp. MLS_C]|nr:MAG: hypothetical protein AVO35_06285 [Candidatus Aegiribacteria sp. MLS_C]